MNIEIPKTRPTSDLEKFVEGLRQLADICHVKSISSIAVHFEDGSYGGYKALWIATGLFKDNTTKFL